MELKKLTETPALIETWAQDIENQVEEGNLSAVKALLFAKVLKDVAERLSKSAAIKPEAIQEASHLIAGGQQDFLGFTIQVRQSGHRYDFSKTPIHKKLLDQIKSVEKISKSLTTGAAAWIDENGEEHIIRPALCKSSETIVFTKNRKS